MLACTIMKGAVRVVLADGACGPRPAAGGAPEARTKLTVVQGHFVADKFARKRDRGGEDVCGDHERHSAGFCAFLSGG